uniref:Uncharacterized protein n=1 Tax=Clostridium sp. enrichment culture clone 7-14 TaxID=598552 RepID=C0KTB2_9CLOT|nr:hypothetical protein [Clostridium sp. enrichment culture clone 7-14]
MTRDLFLKKLYQKLKWRTSLSETLHVVLDYCNLFEKECAQGKSEQEICQKLGSPTLAACNVISTRSCLDRRPFLYKTLWFMGVILLLSLPILSLHGAAYRALWYVYILLAPPLALAFFRLQYVWMIPFNKTPMTIRIFYGTAALSVVICAACSFAMYGIIVHYATIQPQDGPLLHTVLIASIWLIAGIWILSAFGCDGCGYWLPCTHFLYAFCIATLSNYEKMLSSMSLPSLNVLLEAAFKPVPIFALLAIGGALLWIVYIRHKKRENAFAR